LLCCSGTRLPFWLKVWMNSCSYGISIVLLLMDFLFLSVCCIHVCYVEYVVHRQIVVRCSLCT
jgi:hypothetical protein